VNKISRLKTIDKYLDDKLKSNDVLQETCDITSNLVIFTQIRVEKCQKKLCGFVALNIAYENITKEDLYEVFEDLVGFQPDADILKYPFILKSLKHFREEFIDSDDYHLKSFAKLAHKLYLYWRSIAYTEYLENHREKYLENKQSDEDSDQNESKKRNNLKKNKKIRSIKKNEEEEEEKSNSSPSKVKKPKKEAAVKKESSKNQLKKIIQEREEIKDDKT
jgi:hypothetical protein